MSKASDKVTLHDIEIDRFLMECVDLNTEVLTEEMSRISGDYAYWNERYSEANRRQLHAAADTKRAHAAEYLAVRGQAAEKLSETTLKAIVETSTSYRAAVEEEIAAEAAATHLKGVLESLRTKREMLISTGAHQRQEQKGDIKMMERAAIERRAKDFGE